MKLSTISICSNFLFLFFIVSCRNKTHDSSDISIRDTVYGKHISSIDRNDTAWQYDKVYFMKTSSMIEKSNFYYEQCKYPCTDKNTYRIYFERRQVILFCDSILNTFPLNPNNKLDAYFPDRARYQKIRNQAASNKMDHAVSVYELPTLFDRFNPLIQNPMTGETVNYIILKEEERGAGGKLKKYLIKNVAGDTITLAMLPIRAMEVKDIKY